MRNVRCGFLRWRNERGHRDLNIAVDLFPSLPSPSFPLSLPSFTQTQVRQNCLVVGSESPCCKRFPIIPRPVSTALRTARKPNTYLLQVLHALPPRALPSLGGKVERLPRKLHRVIVVEIIDRGCVRDR